MTFSSDQESQKTSSSRSPVALPEGTRLRQEYRVEDVLGMGSFGITYRATDERLDTPVAVKEYYPRQIAGRTDASRTGKEGDNYTVEPYSDQDTEEFLGGLQQFMEKGGTVARFDHPNVVDVKSYSKRTGPATS